jgi:hypothetical protein
MSKAQVYVVRIYGAAPDGSLLGIVEDVERGLRERFNSVSELWQILVSLHRASNLEDQQRHDD